MQRVEPRVLVHQLPALIHSLVATHIPLAAPLEVLLLQAFQHRDRARLEHPHTFLWVGTGML
eukprot:355645-Chlamydomonas_euryale.AAC.34